MSFLHILIIVILLLLIVSVKAVFLYRNKSLKAQHLEHIGQLQLAFEMHQKQLNVRQAHLNLYNFLTYNLEEALLVQSKIKV